MIKPESKKQIHKICLRLLTRREHSQQELLDKLAKKGFAQDESQKVIDELIDQGWQSDQRFAESYARFRIKKGYGPNKIRYELLQRGISEVNLDVIVLDIADGWLEILEQVYEKKYVVKRPVPLKERLKRSRFLQQRGFSNDMIRTLF